MAPAKVNWTLEVLGRRADGYHEVRSVMQTIDICDEVWLERENSLSLSVEGAHSPTDDDHTLQAARLLAQAVGREMGVAIHVRKRIPVSAGLGGGTSDAAAVLRGMARLHGLDMREEEMAATAARIGSDTTFFLHGGTALAQGRGERVTTLPDAGQKWLVVLVPPITVKDKTRRMYEALHAGDFTDGTRTASLVAGLKAGAPVSPEMLYNAFDRAAETLFRGLTRYREGFRRLAGEDVYLAGAGPGMFSLHGTREEAEEVAKRLPKDGTRAFVARTLTAAEATRVWVD